MSAKSVSKMLVKELKEELEKRGLSTAGLKAELAKRLEDAMKSETQESKGQENGKGLFRMQRFTHPCCTADADMKEADCDDVRVVATGRDDAVVVLVVVRVGVGDVMDAVGVGEVVDDVVVLSSFCLVAGSNFSISLIDSVLTEGVSDVVFDVPEAHRRRLVASVGVVTLSLLLLLLLLLLSDDVLTESFRFLLSSASIMLCNGTTIN